MLMYIFIQISQTQLTKTQMKTKILGHRSGFYVSWLYSRTFMVPNPGSNVAHAV